jgi:hypothetical protein
MIVLVFVHSKIIVIGSIERWLDWCRAKLTEIEPAVEHLSRDENQHVLLVPQPVRHIPTIIKHSVG